MCGIAGFLDKTGERSSVGSVMLEMLSALGRRGPDSAGVAVYGPATDGQIKLRIKAGENGIPEGRTERIAARAAILAQVIGSEVAGDYLRLVVRYDGPIETLEHAIEDIAPDIEIISAGHSLELVKQVGSPQRLDATYRVRSFTGTHAIGHTRLSTESRVDLSHSQPFYAHGALDIATAHNGHITNYHKLRRQYEMRGIRFYTENDSEIIGLYLKERMMQGLDFEAALYASMRDFDGSFSYIAATQDQIGFVKDAFGLKPLMLVETPEYVAMATEEQALCAVFGQGVQAREPAPGVVRVWRVPVSPETVGKKVAA
ncbi:MAG: glutamine phosphoribosylpyrophosphate amidotransferase [candidate division Zixibacteria bacterium]|nr:glutamine phosphoribosylpyrophosphate amidotransferase [candidate division Zixibacteria bacterium]